MGGGSMSFFRDTARILHRKLWTFFLVAALTVMLHFYLRAGLAEILSGLPNRDLHFGDYVLLIWGGQLTAFDLLEKTSFRPAFPLLCFLISLLFLNMDLFNQDIHGYGQQTLLRMGSRRRWYLRKLCNCAVVNLLFYAVSLLLLLLLALVNGVPLTTEVNPDFAAALGGFSRLKHLEFDPLTSLPLFCFLQVIPVLLAITVWQIFAELCAGPVLAFVAILLPLLLSFVFRHAALLPDHAMIFRSSLCLEGGNPLSLSLLCSFLYLAAGILGTLCLIDRIHILSQLAKD